MCGIKILALEQSLKCVLYSYYYIFYFFLFLVNFNLLRETTSSEIKEIEIYYLEWEESFYSIHVLTF